MIGSAGRLIEAGVTPARWSAPGAALRGFLLIVALLHPLPVPAQDAPAPLPTIPIDDLTSRTLRAPAELQVAPGSTALDQLPTADFRPLTSGQANRGITGQDHWVRVRLSNANGTEPQSWVLHHETSYLDRLTIHYADNGGPLQRVSLSDRAPFEARPVNYRTLALPHTTPAGGHTDLYVHLGFDKADSLTLNLRLTRADLFHDASRRENLVYGAYFGAMGMFLLIAFIGSVILRESVYLHYAAFLGVSMAMWAMLNGFAYQYLWPDSVYWHNEGFHIVFLLMAITALQFSRGFLKTPRYFPRVNRALVAAQWVFAAGIVLRLAGVYVPVLVLSYLGLTQLVLLSVLGLMAYRRGMRYARWYSVAWLVYGVGLAFSVISAGSGFLEWGMKPLDFAQAGGVLESACLLIALGERLVGWDRARRRAIAIANQDPLTGLGNRRALEEAFDRLEERVQTTGVPVFLAFIDLDHFKAINDEHGHDAGDAVLIHLARILRNACRPEDICIRYGGEELALLLQVPHQEQAMEVTERIRQRFARESTRFEGTEIRHTLTAGIALALARDREPDRAEAIRRADRALYEGKRCGRNRCTAHLPEEQADAAPSLQGEGT
ncbi:diguanylate cyclase [Thiohalorhabdus methylotrophus]|uniref:diguanylate cyclase n=1 Tax=Thiohalorhabdus methylotrophus TaxID=3242694 RepID=A0ABV4TYB3_9GAMM